MMFQKKQAQCSSVQQAIHLQDLHDTEATQTSTGQEDVLVLMFS